MISGRVYDSDRRPPAAIEELLAVIQYRDLIVQLVRRDIVARYKRSALGVAWTMLGPIGTMVVTSIVFARVFGRGPGYPAYVLSGLLAWRFFAQTTTSGMRQILWGGTLMHRIYVPKSVFVISAVGTGLVNVLLSLIPLVGVMLIVRVPLHSTIVLFPVSLLILAAFTLGMGLLLATLAVYFPDIAEMYEIVLTAWQYLTPIIYPEDILPRIVRTYLLNLNPMYHLVKLFREPLYLGIWSSPSRIALAAAMAALTLAIGWAVFTGKSDEFAYRI